MCRDYCYTRCLPWNTWLHASRSLLREGLFCTMCTPSYIIISYTASIRHSTIDLNLAKWKQWYYLTTTHPWKYTCHAHWKLIPPSPLVQVKWCFMKCILHKRLYFINDFQAPFSPWKSFMKCIHFINDMLHKRFPSTIFICTRGEGGIKKERERLTIIAVQWNFWITDTLGADLLSFK